MSVCLGRRVRVSTFGYKLDDVLCLKHTLKAFSNGRTLNFLPVIVAYSFFCFTIKKQRYHPVCMCEMGLE